jgi:mannose/fructose/N-acetylgalactosamine-specific phosphotransferase system component IIC
VTAIPLASFALLLVWGTVVGLDLVSVPQGLLSRPLVAAAVAGWVLGDVQAGLRVGAVLELFALDVLPVGASRYPEYGPAAIAAAVAAGPLGIGVGALLGLLMAMVGGYTLTWVRHANARQIHRLSSALDAGSAAAIARVQGTGLVRDALRGAAVTALGLALAELARVRLRLGGSTDEHLTPVLVGVGLAAAISGTLRIAGRGRRLVWLGAGLAAGLAIALVGAA